MSYSEFWTNINYKDQNGKIYKTIRLHKWEVNKFMQEHFEYLPEGHRMEVEKHISDYEPSKVSCSEWF